LRAKSFTLDGEAVVTGEDGIAMFDALHRRHKATDAMLYAFDLLELNGKDLRPLPLGDRKAKLARLLARASCLSSTPRRGRPRRVPARLQARGGIGLHRIHQRRHDIAPGRSLRAHRDKRALATVRSEAKADRNVMPALMDAVKAYATVGEMTNALVDVYGRFQEPTKLWRKVA
jgi:hypothetical protein